MNVIKRIAAYFERCKEEKLQAQAAKLRGKLEEMHWQMGKISSVTSGQLVAMQNCAGDLEEAETRLAILAARKAIARVL